MAAGGGRRGSGAGGARGGSEAARVARRRIGIALKVGVALGIVWFAVEGGEYGTFDLVRQHRTEARLRAEIDSLGRVVDSLAAYHRRLQTDPVLQERIAREEFGMVRGEKELLYRFADPATPADTSSAASP